MNANGQKILVIDDEAAVRDMYRDILNKEGYCVSVASDGIEGMKKLESDIFSLVLLDIQMPLADGFEVLDTIKEKDEKIPVVVVTGVGTVENAVRALKSGASDFIVKPFSVHDFVRTVKSSLSPEVSSQDISKLKMIETIFELNRVIVSLTNLDLLMKKMASIIFNIFQPEIVAVYLDEDGNFILRSHLAKSGFRKKIPVSCGLKDIPDIFMNKKAFVRKDEKEVITVPVLGKERDIGFIQIQFPENRTVKDDEIEFLEVFAIQAGIGIENAKLFDVVKNSYLNSIRSLVNSLEAKDAGTKGHSEQVAFYAFQVGKELGLKNRELETLRNASYLHDLGKLGIKDSILLKTGALNKEEMNIIKGHPEMTVKILEPLGLSMLEIETCFCHHERIDGTGYPRGLKGGEIPLFAKIISVADAYSAMISERPYRKGMSIRDALGELKKWAGLQFDADVVNAFVKMLGQDENGEVKGDEGN